MKKISFFLGLLCFVAFFTACNKEGKPVANRNILVPPPKDTIPDTLIHEVDGFVVVDTVPWVGSSYKVRCQRYTTDSLSYVKTENDKMYRDNLIKVTITRSDNSVFFDRDFKKSMFDKYFDAGFAKQNVLLGMMLEKDKTDKDNLYFHATVGNPIELMDEFMMFEVIVSRLGDITINKVELDEDKPEEGDETKDAEKLKGS